MSCTLDAALAQTLHEVLRCPICRASQVRTVVASGAKSIRQCLNCDAHFLHPQPSPAEITNYFQTLEQDASASDLERDYQDCRKGVLAQVATAIQARKSRGGILDVGCATGFFLNTFFTGWERAALDLSPRKAELARRGGTRVRVGDLFSARFPCTSFDVATLLDAFYYVRDPQSTIAEFRRVLRDDGILVLEMALATSYIWRRTGLVGRLLGEAALLDASDHLFDYTPRSLSLLLHKCGFIVDDIVTLPANRQERRLPDICCRVYISLSRVAAVLSGGRLCLGPRFMVIARKAPILRGFGVIPSPAR